MTLYSSLLLAALVLGSPFWLFRMVVSGRYRAGLAGRLGRVPPALIKAVAGRNVIWLHAVSVGEVLAATRLIPALEAALPGYLVAISTTTETGQHLARERFPNSPVFYLPLDFAILMRRTLRILRPRLLILMESELWPNMIHECARAGIPIAVANARISDRSFPRYLRLRRLWRPLLAEITIFLAGTAESAQRLLRIGVPPARIRTPGNLKYDVAAPQPTPRSTLLGSRLPPGITILVCGSTLEGEETLLLAARQHLLRTRPEIILILAPRHPARFAAVATLVAAAPPLIRLSELTGQSPTILPGTIVLLDTIGDLASAYSLATVAFVGGSLVPSGGHNPLEPAQFAIPVIIGTSFENFRDIVRSLQAADAIRIVEQASLAPTLTDLLTDPATARALGARGKDVFLANAGATGRVVAELTGLLR